jgi:hypothetical protein
MPATLLIELDRLDSRPKQTCVQCGTKFMPHRVGDGAEEYCVSCYQMRFEKLPAIKHHAHHTQRHVLHHHVA